jgi:hypothetical protein
MNAFRMTAIAATALAGFIGNARAESPTLDPYTPMTSTRTRAEVVAELHAARASGLLAQLHAEDGGSFALARQAFVPGKTRAEVRAEVLAARASGELAAMSGEDSGSFHLARARTATPDAPRLAGLAR